ncbi:uncharacterized protein LOC117790179 [Drosophila innubila]|uniref:uncharacterized protein LOC117790179 n=1 Tax=Drosophila innubila TaxID=198719 RepID=UPI00148CAFC4|nr:uncharacterized protein LOC117790179 [Drosophila innubila]
MLTATLFVIFLVICPQLQTHAQNNTEVDLQNSQNALQTVKLALEEKLPANTEAREMGNEILAALERGLKICDENLKKDSQIAAYNMCVASNKGLAMASLGELAGQQWAKSGASRPGLFF